MKNLFLRTALASMCMLPLAALAEDAIVVNVDNFNKAQTDHEFAGTLKMTGGINKFVHNRAPTPVDKQNVIRMNRDTLYSMAVVDISNGATITLPDAGKRYMSLMLVNNDGYVNKVFYGAGAHKLTMEQFDTPFVFAAVRTLANPEDKADLAEAHKLQDQIKIEAGSAQAYVLPDYDEASYKATLGAVLELAKGLKRYTRTFGSRDEVDPVHFMIGSASAWGGLPDKDAQYDNIEPKLPVGNYELTVKDVPVKGILVDQPLQRARLFPEERPACLQSEQSDRKAEQRWLLHGALWRLHGQHRELPADHGGLELQCAHV